MNLEVSEQELRQEIEELRRGIDELRHAIPALYALGELLVEAHFVTKAKRLHQTTISKNQRIEKFQSIGERRLLMKLSSVNVVKQRAKRV